MFTRCLFCHTVFPANRALERLPVGRRIAYDPGRGRLWVVCPACQRWTLQPIEERWETLEDLERLGRGRGRLLIQTENIALIDVYSLQIIRVGRARLREEAWWRYGREFASRRARSRQVVRRGRFMEAFFMLLLTGVPIWGWRDANHWLNRARRKRFGRMAWRGLVVCEGCGAMQKTLTFPQTERLIITPGTDASVSLWGRCDHCRDQNPGAGFRLDGLPATHLLRRVLAHRNYAGAADPVVTDAVGLIDASGSAANLTRFAAQDSLSLGRLDGTRAVALEIAVNEERERQLLELEAAALEASWRREEELAAIIDGELTPLLTRSRRG